MRRALVFAALMLLAPAVFANDDGKPKPYVIALQDDPQVAAGKLARITGQTDDKGPLMELQELTPWQPVMVEIISHDQTVKLHVKVSKPVSGDVIFEGDTDQDGTVTAKFRSHHAVDILVTSASGKKGFSLVTWVGPAIAPPMKSVLRTIE